MPSTAKTAAHVWGALAPGSQVQGVIELDESFVVVDLFERGMYIMAFGIRIVVILASCFVEFGITRNC